MSDLKVYDRMDRRVQDGHLSIKLNNTQEGIYRIYREVQDAYEVIGGIGRCRLKRLGIVIGQIRRYKINSNVNDGIGWIGCYRKDKKTQEGKDRKVQDGQECIG